MRNYIQSARSPNAKPIHSQSPLQKKKLLKFVNQTIKHEKSMQGLSILNHNNAQNAPPVEGFKVEIERRYQESQMNLLYKFPRDISSSPSSHDSSLENLKNMKEYDLHTQNFREKTLDNKIEHLIGSAKKKSKKSENNSYQSGIRVLTSPPRDFEDSKIGTANSKLGTLVSPKDQEAALYKKVLTLLENNSNKEGTIKMPRTPNYSDQNNLLKQEFKRKLKMQRNDSQENLFKKSKSHFRAKSLLKETSNAGHKSSNLNSELNNDIYNLNMDDQRSDIKMITLGDDESLLGFNTSKKMTVTKSCKDLKLNSSRTIRQPEFYYDGLDLKLSQENKIPTKPGTRYGQRHKKFLTNDPAKSSLTNKTSDSIAQKPERGTKTFRDLDMRHEEEIKNETSTLATNFTEGQNMSREFLSSKEGSRSNLFNKIQENASLKAKITQGFKSPTHVSLRTLTTLPLTARNDVENKTASKNPLMSFRSPREKKIVIPLGSQNKMTVTTVDKTSEKPDSERLNHPSRKLTKTSSAKNICQTTKSQKASTQKIPKLFLSKNVESDKKENRTPGPENSQKDVKGSLKKDVQIMLKRNGPLSDRHRFDESEGRIKSYYK